jgi:hypothetical protein
LACLSCTEHDDNGQDPLLAMAACNR